MPLMPAGSTGFAENAVRLSVRTYLVSNVFLLISKIYSQARAPEDWIKQMHGTKAHWREQPNYGVLVDTRDRQVPQLTYVPQENLEVSHFQVLQR